MNTMMSLQSLRRSGGDAVIFDGSRPLFRVGGYPRVSELLQALPMIKADPVGATPPASTGAAFTMKVTVQRVDGALPQATFYDNNTDLAELANGLNSEDFNVARIGERFSVPKIDANVTARGTALDGAEWRMYAAASATLQAVDTAIARGTSVGQVAEIVGLQTLASNWGRATATSGDIDQDARQAIAEVCPSGMGAGEGPTCLATGTTGLRRLMASTVGQSASSGWKFDKRTGLMVYHYQGLPVYRTDVLEQTTTRLYAINLGGTGLNLVHTVGTPDTFGLVCEADALSTSRASQDFVVHGAFGLVLWEPEAIYEVSGIALTPV